MLEIAFTAVILSGAIVDSRPVGKDLPGNMGER
jgi:hypothetical protein